MPHNLCRLCSLALLLLLAALTEAARPSPRGVPRKPAVKPAAKPAAERGFRFFSIAVGGDKSPSKRPKAVRAPASKKAAADSQSLIDIDIGRQLNALREQMADFRPVQVFSGFALATVLFGSSLAFTGSAINGFMEEVDSNGPVLERTLQFGTILESVMSGYVDKNVDLNQLFETGVNAMLSTLDPYSECAHRDRTATLSLRRALALRRAASRCVALLAAASRCSPLLAAARCCSLLLLTARGLIPPTGTNPSTSPPT